MFTETILVALITAGASVLCQLLISHRANNLMQYRIEELDKKVTKHNNLIERMYVVEERAKSNSHRLDDLERVK